MCNLFDRASSEKLEVMIPILLSCYKDQDAKVFINKRVTLLNYTRGWEVSLLARNICSLKSQSKTDPYGFWCLIVEMGEEVCVMVLTTGFRIRLTAGFYFSATTFWLRNFWHVTIFKYGIFICWMENYSSHLLSLLDRIKWANTCKQLRTVPGTR